MYTDECEIVNISSSKQFGENIEGTPFKVQCRVEDSPKMNKGSIGNETEHRRLYILPPGTNISNGDKIRTTKRRGVIISEEYIIVQSTHNIGRLYPHHIEVKTAGVSK